MKSNNLKTILAISLLTSLLFACSKKDEEAPSIAIEMPLATSTYHVGDTLNVKGSVLDNEGMHMATITVTNLSDSNRVILTFGGHIHDNPYDFSGSVVLDVPENSNLSVKVVAEDESENESIETVEITILP